MRLLNSRSIGIKSLTSWWRSEAGGREVFRLALPMIISAGSLALMQFADRVFLTWYSEDSMAAAFSGGQFFWLLIAFPFSVISFTNAFISQYHGARSYRKIGPNVWQGILLSFLITPLFYALVPVFQPIFKAFHHSEAMCLMETTYLLWLLVGVAPMLASEALCSFFIGQKRSRIVMVVNLIAVGLNLLLDYAMIFGRWGFPSWGLAGAAIATSLSQWIRFVIFFIAVVLEDRRKGGLFCFNRGCAFSWRESRKILKYGGMGGVQLFIEMGSWSIFVLLVGMVGTIETEATAIAFNLNALTFLPILGLGNATLSLVGNYLGSEQLPLARKATFSALKIGLVFTFFFMFFYIYAPHLLLLPYQAGEVGELSPALDSLSVILMKFVAVYLLFDTWNMIFASALRGGGDTRFILCLSLSTMPFLTIIPWMGIRFFGLGIYWCWSLLTGLICVVSFCYAIRFFRGNWWHKLG